MSHTDTTAWQAPNVRVDSLAVHSAWMRRLAQALVGEAAADDVMQEAWTKLGARPARPHERSYLRMVVRSLAFQKMRSEGRRKHREEVAARGEALPSAEECASRAEMIQSVGAALQALQDPYRSALVMHYFDDLSAAEIARRAGIPAATVRSRIHRGLEQLRKGLDQEHGGRSTWMLALLPWTQGGAASRPTSETSGSLDPRKWTLLTAAFLLAGITAGFLWKGTAPEVDTLQPTSMAAEVAAQEALDELPEDEGQAEVALQERTSPLYPQPSQNGPADPRQYVLHAQALAVDGKPIPGAWLRPEYLPDREQVADDAGHLRLAFAADEEDSILSVRAPKLATLIVGAPGHARRVFDLELPAEPGLASLGAVTLRPGGSLSGTLIDPSGHSVEGATVRFTAPIDPEGTADVWKHSGPHPIALRDSRASVATTGADGRFELSGIPPGFGTLWARSETSFWAFSPEPIGIRAGEHRGGLELRLEDASHVAMGGTLKSPDGTPLAGIDLQASGANEWLLAKSDAFGRFSFLPPESGSYQVNVFAPDAGWNRIVTQLESGQRDVELTFEVPPMLSLRLADEEGRPLPSGEVTALDPESQNALRGGRSTLDEVGQVQLKAPTQSFLIRASAPGYEASVEGPFDPEAFPADLMLALEPQVALQGTVLGPDRQPVPGAYVSLHRGASDESSKRYLTHEEWRGQGDPFIYRWSGRSRSETRTDRDGLFRLPVPTNPGSGAGGAGMGMALDDFAAYESVAARVDSLRSAGAAGPPSQGFFFSSSGGLQEDVGLMDTTQGSQTPDGWFLVAHLPGHGEASLGPLLLEELQDAAQESEPVLQLRLSGTGRLQGTLFFEGQAESSARAGWIVRANNGGARTFETITDEQGHYGFDPLPAGPWQVRVFEPRSRFFKNSAMRPTATPPTEDAMVRAAASTAYDLKVPRPQRATLRGHLTLDGAPAGPWLLHARQGHHSSVKMSLDPEGFFELELPAGGVTTLRFSPVQAVVDTFTLTTEIELVPGPNEWSLDVETGRIDGQAPCGEPSYRSYSRPAALQYSSRRDELEFTLAPTLRGERLLRPMRVPAGPGELHSCCESQSLELWKEIDVAPGEVLQVEPAKK